MEENQEIKKLKSDNDKKKKEQKLREILNEKFQEKGKDGLGKSPFKPLIFWSLVAVLMLLLIQVYLKKQKPTVKLKSFQLEEQIERTNIVSFVFHAGSINVDGKIMIDPADTSLEKIESLNLKEIKAPEEMQFKSTVSLSDDTRNEIQKRLKELNIPFNVKESNRYLEMLISSVLPILLVVLIIGFLINRQMKRGMGMAASFGQSRARRDSKEGKDKITFKDVAGCDEAKEEVTEIIDYLRDPKKFEKLGGRIPRGVILVGAPGTGKTLLAKAVAGEADVPFFTISGSDFVEMFVGVGASRVRDLFQQGKKHAPCIIFIDEIDAVGRHRGAGIGGGHDEREQTLNALLVEMDGFNANDGVILVAATNRPDVLDPALLRPGRFDRQIVIDMPDQKGRKEILEIHAKKIKVDKSVSLEKVARGTPGFSGADLANLVNESALMAARQNKETVTQDFFEEARDKIRFGRERRSRKMDENDRKYTACHEAGHALVTALIPECEPLHKVTIVPRGIAYLGATMQLPEKDKYHQTKKEVEGILVTLMGGRVAEEVALDDITSGARSDIKQATDLARKMVCEWGMTETMGPLAYGEKEEHIFLGREIDKHVEYSEQTAQKIDEEVRKLIDAAYAKAKNLILENRDKLEAITQALIEFEVIDGEEVTALINGEKIRTEEGSSEDKTENEEAKQEQENKQEESEQSSDTSE